MTDLDPTSYANSHSILTTHIHIDWNINFVQTKLEGNVELSLQAQEDVNQVVSSLEYIHIYYSTNKEKILLCLLQAIFIFLYLWSISEAEHNE